jgi:PKD repeat protein
MRRYFTFLVLQLFYLPFLYSQIYVPGTPESFNIKTKSEINLPVKLLDAIDTSKLLKDDFDNGIPNRYGILQQIDADIKSVGTITFIPGKGYIWRYQIKSPFTFSLGIQFSKFHLPKGATVFIYNDNNSRLMGAFTSLNNNSDNQLAIAEFTGNNATVEYFEPLNSEFSGELEIGSVSQAYRNFQSILQSSVGINCPQAAGWQVLKRAICRMTFHDNVYEYLCSGSLVNNKRIDGTPYFLTANHCLKTTTVASTLIVYFNYESDTCNGIVPDTIQTLSGSSLVATNAYSDFTLLKLYQIPPNSYQAYYAGWDATGAIAANGTCIHHPGGRVKSIAIANSPPASSLTSIPWDDGTVSAPNSHWTVHFDIGTVESGSSGSPMFDDHKRVIGQLHGGVSTESEFGKFSISWRHSTKSSEQLAYWLNPDNSDTIILDGFDSKFKPIPNFTANLTTVCVNSPVRFTDYSKYLPNKLSWKFEPSTYEFVNGTDSNSISPEVVFLNAGSYSATLTATNENGSNSLRRDNYITAGSSLDVKLSGLTKDTTICGHDFTNIPVKENGAINYYFSVKDSDKINYRINNNFIFLTLKPEILDSGSFDTYIKLTGTQGTCKSSDSLKLSVVIPVYDNIKNAFNLQLGQNGKFSNECASVENSEPHPDIRGCLTTKSWCTDTANSGAVLHNTIWFTFTGPLNGIVSMGTSGFDTRICVYQAEKYQDIISGNTSLFKILDANDDRSETDKTSFIDNLRVESGKKYWLQLDGNNGASDSCYVYLYSDNVEALPNPTKGNLEILISYPKELPATISIYSVLGQKLLTKQVFVTNFNNKFSFDLSNLVPGVYFIGIEIDNRIQRKKILVVR